MDLIDVEITVHRENTSYLQRFGGDFEGSICQVHWRLFVLLHENTHSQCIVVRQRVKSEFSCLHKSP